MQGAKKKVYVLIKILKVLTDSPAQSYHCKYTWDEVLNNRHSRDDTDINESEIGTALHQVIRHSTIRGKFNSVHPDLRAQGIVKVEVGEKGFIFHKDGWLDTGDQDTGDIGQAEVAGWVRNLGIAAFNAKDYRRALTYFEKSCNMLPESMEAWTSLGSALSEINALIEVKPHFLFDLKSYAQCAWVRAIAAEIGGQKKIESEAATERQYDASSIPAEPAPPFAKAGR